MKRWRVEIKNDIDAPAFCSTIVEADNRQAARAKGVVKLRDDEGFDVVGSDITRVTEIV